MGLDQFLTAKKFFWSSDNKDKQKAAIKKHFPEMKGKKLDYVIFQVGDWRKANQIHKWFVDNVQDGNDNCASYHVEREQLKQLLELCKQVLNGWDKNIAEEKLPTTDGFFFGTAEYDEAYMEDLKNTIKIMEDCLKLPEEWDFEYSSSW